MTAEQLVAQIEEILFRSTCFSGPASDEDRLEAIELVTNHLSHLERGVAMLQYIFDCADANVEPGELDVQRTQAWIAEEKWRKSSL